MEGVAKNLQEETKKAAESLSPFQAVTGGCAHMLTFLQRFYTITVVHCQQFCWCSTCQMGHLLPQILRPPHPCLQQKKHPRPGFAIERRRIWKGAVSLRNHNPKDLQQANTREVTWFPTQRKYKSTPYKIKNHNRMSCSKGQLHHKIHHHDHCRSGQPLEQFQAFSLLRWIFAFPAGKASKRGFGLGYTRGKSSMASLHHVWV